MALGKSVRTLAWALDKAKARWRLESASRSQRCFRMSRLAGCSQQRTIISLLFILVFSHYVGAKEVTNVILVGATGDLAKRYLWEGFFDLYLQENGDVASFRFYAAAREDKVSGTKKMEDILAKTVRCEHKNIACDSSAVTNFKRLTEYFPLKKEEDYAVLCSAIRANIKEEDRETGRIFYLSVPPFAYAQIAKAIDVYCRPMEARSLMRVVFEKPFGSDLESSRKLANTLSEYLREEEIYRIDHYLGKPGVGQILKFRLQNDQHLGDLWNKDHIERVEIVLKETSDCEGRTGFYDQYGVIRDVMQNHMTELLAMVAMETPRSLGDTSDIHKKKLRLLEDIRPLGGKNTVVGQYKAYNMHRGEPNTESVMPTFAAVFVSVDNARWYGVPFLLMSGKKLDERVAYVRLIFKDNAVKVGGTSGSQTCGKQQVIFHIQGGEIQKPALIISRELLPNPVPAPGWHQDLGTFNIFGCRSQDFFVFSAQEWGSAYSKLISGVFHGHKDLFVGTDDLLASWKVWTPLLESLNGSAPRLYDSNELNTIDISLKGTEIDFSQEDLEGTCEKDKCPSSHGPEGKYKIGSFRGSPLLSGTKVKVILKLASDIESAALRAVQANGVFHLALSGGSTPAPLYEELSFSRPGFPWRQTHVWFVDERCVAANSKSSNFFNLDVALLRNVHIPHVNVHPMPISLQKGHCHFEDSGASHYEAALKRSLGNGRLDFVLLGVGSDGHTASLFPWQPSVQETERWVTLTESGGASPMNERMSMTLPVVNSARSVAILILGEGKRDIVRRLSRNDSRADFMDFPVAGVTPTSGNLGWYIDDHALGTVTD